jgi:hypothetical protein
VKSDLLNLSLSVSNLPKNPIVREAFFPTDAHTFGVEPARPDDDTSILDIARRWDGPEAVRCLELWWQNAPQSFSVVRDPERKLAGIYRMFDSESVTSELCRADLVVQWFKAGKPSTICERLTDPFKSAVNAN